MTRIIIEGLLNRASLISAISTVLQTMNHDDAFDRDEQVFLPGSDDDEPDAPPMRTLLETAESTALRAPLPYLPCRNRGEHGALTDCWMCWCDVMRGAALEPEVLSHSAWQWS